MRFQSIRIKEGLLERTINFSDGANLIHSTKNSCGKTTLLRLLLYSIGYNIPSTKRMRFDQCEVETHLYCDALGELSVIRYNKDFLELTHGNQKSTIVLPAQELEFHKLLFGNCNDDILLNLLGTFCNGVQREHNKKLNNGLPILHKVPPKRDYGRYFCIMAEKGGTSHGGLTEKLSPFFHAKKQEVNAYGR